MPLPTMGRVISKIQSYQNGGYAQVRREILDRLEILDKNNVDQFNNYLLNLLNNSQYDKKFKKTIYKLVLVLGQLFPRNVVQNNNAVDPITLEEIDLNDMFISVDRYQWSIRSLIRFFSTKNTYINPITNLEFSSLDVYHIQKMATKCHLTIRFHTNADNRPNSSRSVAQQTKYSEISSLLYGFFKLNETLYQVNSPLCPMSFGGPYTYRHR